MEKNTKKFSMKGFMYLMHNPFMSDKEEERALRKEALDILNWMFGEGKKKLVVAMKWYDMARAVGLPFGLDQHVSRINYRKAHEQRNFYPDYSNLELILEHGRTPRRDPIATIETFIGCGCYEKSLKFFTEEYGPNIDLPRSYSYRDFKHAYALNKKKEVEELYILLPIGEAQSVTEAIKVMPEIARIAEEIYRQPVTIYNNHPAQMVAVKWDSDPELILRDRRRATMTYEGDDLWIDCVGPYPVENLTEEQIAKDKAYYEKMIAPIRETSDRRFAEEQKRKESDQKEALRRVEVGGLMDRDEDSWKELTTPKKKEDPEYVEVMRYFIDRFARLIQFHLAAGLDMNLAIKAAEIDIEKIGAYASCEYLYLCRGYIDKVISGCWKRAVEYQDVREKIKAKERAIA